MSEHNLKPILLALLQKHHFLSVKQMLTDVAASGRKFNKTSVYRALNQLEADGIICQQHFSGPEAAYELLGHHHSHLVCQNCGQVQSAECSLETPKKINGFQVDHHHVTLMGICSKCLAIESVKTI